MTGMVINLDGRPDRLETFRRQEFPFEVKRIKAIKSRIGEDGCTQSHLLALRSITEFPTFIAEDDCKMLVPWSEVEKAMSQLPNDFDALWLGANLQRPLKRYSDNLFILREAYCLHATIYNSQRMIDFILNNHNTPSGKNLDIFYHDVVMERFNCYAVFPMCANQRDGVSNICGDYTCYGDELAERYVKMTIG